MGNDSDSDLETNTCDRTRIAVKKIIDEAQLVLTPEQQARRAKADEADRKAAEVAVGLLAAKQADEKQAAVVKQALEIRNEVVIVGTVRFMPPPL